MACCAPDFVPSCRATQAATLTLLAPDTINIGDEVRALLPRYFIAFFDDIADAAPGLGSIRLIAPRTGDRKLH